MRNLPMRFLLLLTIVIAALSAWASIKNRSLLRIKTRQMAWAEEHLHIQESLPSGSVDLFDARLLEKRVYDTAVVIQWMLFVIFIVSVISIFVIVRELRKRRFSS